MSRTCRGSFGFRSSMMLLTLLSLMCITGRQAPAQLHDRLSVESQPVLKTYPIVKAYAAEAERVIKEVFAQRKISVSHHPGQNIVMVWATDSEHSQIEYFLNQQRVLGTQLPRSESSLSLISVIQRRQDAKTSNLFRNTRFANTQANDVGRNVPAVWQDYQNQNGPAPNHVYQVAGHTQTQAPPSLGITPLTSSQPSNQATRHIALQKLSASEFEAKILNAMQSRSVQLSRSGSANQAVYTIPLPDGQQIVMTIDRNGNVVSISGPGSQIETFAQVVSLIEDETPNSVTGVVPITPGNESSIRDLARLVSPQNAGQFGGSQNQPLGQTTSGNGIRIGDQNIGQTNGTQNDQTGPPLPPNVGGLVGPLDITILGGHVVIKARTSGDLELARKIVEYIEATSREYDPVIVEVPMVHADCMRVAYVTQQLYTQWYDTQYGTVSITPLVRPNSILLIGYPGSIEAARELIAKLDSPIDAEAQFQVFQLRHAAADTLKETLDNFYTARTSTTATTGGTTTLTTGQGMASEVNIVSDQRTNSLIIQAAPRDLLEIATLVLKLDQAGNDVEMEVKIFPLRNTLASNLATLLQEALAGQALAGMMGGSSQQLTAPQSGVSFTTIDPQQGKQILSAGIFSGVSVVADTNGNNLVVKAPPECLPVIRAVIESLDAPPLAVAKIKVFTIINSDASTLLTTLESIFSTTTTGGGAGGSSFTNYRMGSANENSAMVPVRFASEARTNSIIAAGTEDMLAMVEAILLTLDEPEMHNRRYMVYRLLNTPADTIASTLQTFLQNERQLRQQSNALVGEVDIFNSEIIITAETETNSLLVCTTPRYADPLRRMIQVLDEQPAMVQIKVVIAEVDTSNTDELGFELGLQDSVLFDRSVLNADDFQTITQITNVPGVGQTQEQIIISESRNPGFNFNSGDALGNNNSGNSNSVGTQGLSNFAMGRQNSELGYGGFVFSASSESVSVLIRALEERQRLTVLNNPTLNALHNQPSTLSVGQEVPTITSVNIDSSTGYQTNNIENEEVGILLEITPRIALNNTVTMSISAQKSSMDAEANGTPIFVQGGQVIRSAKKNSASISTTIRTESGQVAVLGGLNSQEDQHVHRAVPIVSRIPLIGELFQYNYKYCKRKELIFIFTPQVYRDSDEAFAINQLAMARMQVCAQHISGMLDNNHVKTRTGEFTTSETDIERGKAIMLDETEIPSESTLIEDSTHQDRMLPQQPTRAPAFPKPSVL